MLRRDMRQASPHGIERDIIAQAAGLGRANLYKALSPDGNPEFATVARVLKALGLRLSVAA
jgi:probable addiction module antidote protein